MRPACSWQAHLCTADIVSLSRNPSAPSPSCAPVLAPPLPLLPTLTPAKRDTSSVRRCTQTSQHQSAQQPSTASQNIRPDTIRSSSPPYPNPFSMALHDAHGRSRHEFVGLGGLIHRDIKELGWFRRWRGHTDESVLGNNKGLQMMARLVMTSLKIMVTISKYQTSHRYMRSRGPSRLSASHSCSLWHSVQQARRKGARTHGTRGEVNVSESVAHAASKT